MPSHAPPRRRARPHVSARSRAFARAHTSAIFPSPSSAPVSRSRPSSPACPLSLCLSLSLCVCASYTYLPRALHRAPAVASPRRASRSAARHRRRASSSRAAPRAVRVIFRCFFWASVPETSVGRTPEASMPPWAVPPVPPVPPSVTHESRPRVCHPEDCAYPSPSSSSSSVVVVVVVRGRRRPWSPGQRSRVCARAYAYPRGGPAIGAHRRASSPSSPSSPSTTGGGRPRDVVDVDASISIDRCVDASIDVDIDRHIAARRRARGCRGFDRESRWRRR